MDNALAKSTRQSYGSAKRRYHSFCSMFSMSPLPTNEYVLCKYVSFLASNGVRSTSIKCYLAAIRHLHIENGLGDPRISVMAKLELVLRGVKVTPGVKQKVQPRQPITPDLLHKLHGLWLGKTAQKDGRMLWAAAILCFCGFLRSGEVTIPTESAFDEATHLTFGNLAVDQLHSPTMLKVHLKASKIDPFQAGVDVYVGKTGTTLCPVTAMLAYLGVRGSGAGPLFRFSDGRPLTRARFVELVKKGALRSRGRQLPILGT